MAPSLQRASRQDPSDVVLKRLIRIQPKWKMRQSLLSISRNVIWRERWFSIELIYTTLKENKQPIELLIERVPLQAFFSPTFFACGECWCSCPAREG